MTILSVKHTPWGTYSPFVCTDQSTLSQMQRRTNKTLTRAAAVAVASAFLTGCFTVEATFTINDDATADLDYRVLIDTEQLDEFSSLLGEEAGALDGLSGDALLEELTGDEDPCGDLTGEFTEFEVSTRQVDEGGEVGVGCTVTGVPISELNSLGDDTSSFSIEQDEAGTRFTGVLEGVDELAGDPSETEMMTDMLGASLDELFTIQFVVTAPGSLGENNASSTDGSTATWDVKVDSDFVTDGDATMTAQWTPGGGGSGSSIWIILAIIAAVLALAALAIVLVKRSKDATPNAGDAPDARPAPDTTMSPPAPPAGMAPPTASSPPAPPTSAPPTSAPPTPPPPPPS